jgi:hypothetical protein
LKVFSKTTEVLLKDASSQQNHPVNLPLDMDEG